MKVKVKERLRRDWFILLLIVLVGVCFMLIAGQQATRLVSDWIMRADMRSNLDPNARFRNGPRTGNVEPLNSDILTPPIWNETYLTPMPDDNVTETAVTMVVFDPSVTPSVTPSPTPTVSQTPDPNPTVTASPSPSPTVVVTATRTKKPDDDPPPSPTPSLPPPVTSTVDPTYVEDPLPAGLDVGSPDNTTANIAAGHYVVVDVTAGGVNPAITVVGPSETNYDLVYYEWNNGGIVELDDVIVGISQDPTGNPYYEVFNWGDNNPDTNTNVDTSAAYPADPSSIPPDPACPADPECDNRDIPLSELYDPASPPAEPQTGILIDVDNAPSNPPPGNYPYVVIISPSTGGDDSQVDSIELVEEPPPP